MHAFVAAILFRMSWLGPLVGNAEPQPPRRQLGQSGQALIGEGGTVVGSKHSREPVFADRLRERLSRRQIVGGFPPLSAKPVTATQVTGRQRVAVAAVA